ncbi:trypsin-like peptidase domain-containing protein [Actinoallomurus iriomotensis]|uniref:Peptidase n=1 Tax=Actinoallomurus iriomotensis TaxID=478107 RepID=A0A9W6RV90_9ACTN|nr:trypsin-like peptidase domain-containing protein [Actinoallomurus iriomotensis]GLY83246.1 peptidase [Actinoallomurus iriomotensis]
MPSLKRKALAAAATVAAGLCLPASPVHADTRIPVGAGTGIIQQLIQVDGGGYTEETCTMTAVGHDAAGNLVGLTNAHCFLKDGKKVEGDKVYYDTTPAGTAAAPAPVPDPRPAVKIGAIGTVTYISTPNNLLTIGQPHGLDYAVIKLDPTKVKATDTVTSSTGTAKITSIGDVPAFGTRMCKQGHRTGVTCGATLVRNGRWYTTLIWTQPGDSGSPVYNGNALVGSAWGAQHFTPFKTIVADMNSHGGVGAGFHVG